MAQTCPDQGHPKPMRCDVGTSVPVGQQCKRLLVRTFVHDNAKGTYRLKLRLIVCCNGRTSDTDKLYICCHLHKLVPEGIMVKILTVQLKVHFNSKGL